MKALAKRIKCLKFPLDDIYLHLFKSKQTAEYNRLPSKRQQNITDYVKTQLFNEISSKFIKEINLQQNLCSRSQICLDINRILMEKNGKFVTLQIIFLKD